MVVAGEAGEVLRGERQAQRQAPCFACVATYEQFGFVVVLQLQDRDFPAGQDVVAWEVDEIWGFWVENLPPVVDYWDASYPPASLEVLLAGLELQVQALAST